MAAQLNPLDFVTGLARGRGLGEGLPVGSALIPVPEGGIEFLEFSHPAGETFPEFFIPGFCPDLVKRFVQNISENNLFGLKFRSVENPFKRRKQGGIQVNTGGDLPYDRDV
jgi:hypothetical protein